MDTKKRKTNCIKNGKPMYRTTLLVGHNKEGKPVRKNFFGKSIREAESKKELYKQTIAHGLNLEIAEMSLSEAMRLWLFEVKKPDNRVKPSSFERYHSIHKNYVEGYPIGKKKVDKIKSLDVQRHLNDLEKEGKSNSLLKTVYKIMKMFFIYAEEQNYISKSPCTRGITIPGERPYKKEVETFSDQEIEILKKHLENDHRLRLIVLLALGTGLRRGELLALRYDDIREGGIYVDKSLAKPTNIEANGDRHTEFCVWEPKSNTSRRFVPLPGDLSKEIELHRQRQISEQLAVGFIGEPDFLFTTATGNFIDPTNFCRAFSRLLKRAGIPHKKFHALRHTYASKLVQKGVDINTIQGLMGHSNITITSIYFHADRKVMTESVQKLNIWFQ